MALRHWTLIVIVVLSLRAGSPSDAAFAQDRQGADAFNPLSGTVLAVIDGEVLWTDATLVESTKGHRVQTFSYRCVLENLKEPHQRRVVFEKADTDPPPRGTITPNETVIIYWDNRLIRCAAGQPAQVSGELVVQDERASVVGLFPEGAIVQPDRYGRDQQRLAPLWWIPFKDAKLDLRSKVRLTNESEDAGRYLAFLRSGKEIAWLDASRTSRDIDAQSRRPPTLFVFDVAAQTVRTVPLHEHSIKRGARLRGFDGTHAFTGTALIDVKTGDVSKTAFLDALGMRKGVIYAVKRSDKRYEVKAVPASAPTNGEIVYDWNIEDFRRDLRDGRRDPLPQHLFLIDEDRLWGWSGRTWTALEMPR